MKLWRGEGTTKLIIKACKGSVLEEEIYIFTAIATEMQLLALFIMPCEKRGGFVFKLTMRATHLALC